MAAPAVSFGAGAADAEVASAGTSSSAAAAAVRVDRRTAMVLPPNRRRLLVESRWAHSGVAAPPRPHGGASTAVVCENSQIAGADRPGCAGSAVGRTAHHALFAASAVLCHSPSWLV